MRSSGWLQDFALTSPSLRVSWHTNYWRISSLSIWWKVHSRCQLRVMVTVHHSYSDRINKFGVVDLVSDTLGIVRRYPGSKRDPGFNDRTGMGFPSIMALISVHIPAHEHSRAIGFVLSGSYLGAVVANLVAGPLVDAPGYGWRSVFYIFGFVGLLWLVPWLLFTAPPLDRNFLPLPTTDPNAVKMATEVSGEFVNVTQSDVGPSVSSRSQTKRRRDDASWVDMADCGDSSAMNVELLAVEASKKKTRGESTDVQDDYSRDAAMLDPHDSDSDLRQREGSSLGQNIPWGKIMRTKEVWAIICVQFCQSWSFWLLINWMPTYYKDVFHVDIKHLGYFTGKLGNDATSV